MNDNSPDLLARIADLEARIRRLEGTLEPSLMKDETITHVKALIKNGSNAWYNGQRENPHPHGTRESELWQYGADLAHDVSGGN